MSINKKGNRVCEVFIPEDFEAVLCKEDIEKLNLKPNGLYLVDFKIIEITEEYIAKMFSIKLKKKVGVNE